MSKKVSMETALREAMRFLTSGLEVVSIYIYIFLSLFFIQPIIGSNHPPLSRNACWPHPRRISLFDNWIFLSDHPRGRFAYNLHALSVFIYWGKRKIHSASSQSLGIPGRIRIVLTYDH